MHELIEITLTVFAGLAVAIEPVNWLGFLVVRDGDKLVIRVAPRAWDRLAEQLALAQERPASPLVAEQVLRGWVDQLGPHYASENRNLIVERTRQMMRRYAFGEVFDADQVLAGWAAAHARWTKLKKQIGRQLHRRLAQAGIE